MKFNLRIPLDTKIGPMTRWPLCLMISVKPLDEGEPPEGVSTARNTQRDSSEHLLDFLSIMCFGVRPEREDQMDDLLNAPAVVLPPDGHSGLTPYQAT